VQHHVASTLLPHAGRSVVTYHLLDIDYHFINRANDIDNALHIFGDIGRGLNVSLIVFGGGGLLQPGYSHTKTRWRLPLNALIARQIGTPYIVYGVGVNVFRGRSAPPTGKTAADATILGFSAAERAAMRESILSALSFSVRNDGSHAALLSLFPGDAEVQAKVWEIADPGMMLPSEHSNLVRDALPLARPATSGLPSGWMAFQPAWNKDKTINNNRLPPADFQSLAQFLFANRPTYLPHTPVKDYVFMNQVYSGASGRKALASKRESMNANYFKSHITFGNHEILLSSLYGSRTAFDAAIVMRGHGLYLCIALNIPCIALSTQDKVAGFARRCSLDEYLVDVQPSRKWQGPLASTFSQLQYNASFRDGWHQKRAKCLLHWAGISDRFHEDMRTRFLAHRNDGTPAGSTRALGQASVAEPLAPHQS